MRSQVRIKFLLPTVGVQIGRDRCGGVVGDDQTALGRPEGLKRAIAVAGQHQAEPTGHPAGLRLGPVEVLGHHKVRVPVAVEFCKNHTEARCDLCQPR